MSHGFSIFFLADEPKFPKEFDDMLGYRPDYKGLGVFLYRSEKRKQWVSNSGDISRGIGWPRCGNKIQTRN